MQAIQLFISFNQQFHFGKYLSMVWLLKNEHTKVFIAYYPKLSQQQRFEGKKILTKGDSLTSRMLASGILLQITKW